MPDQPFRGPRAGEAAGCGAPRLRDGRMGADRGLVQPFRLAAAPARQFLNTSFTEMPSSVKREARPTALLHPETMAQLGLADGDPIRLGNERGSVLLHARARAGQHAGT